MKQSLGERINYWCKRRGVKPSELARRLDVDRGTISNLIADKRMPSIETLEAITKALKTDLARFFSPDVTYFDDPEMVVLMGRIERLSRKNFRHVQSFVDKLLREEAAEKTENLDEGDWTVTA